MSRWWVYQRERFPVIAHGPLIAAFSASAVSFAALLRSDLRPPLQAYLVAFIVSFGSFFLLRVADEFKDAEEDAKYRAYRPVPRGLIKLRELALIGVGVAAVQLALASWIGWRLDALLGVTWVYFALMSREFFVRAWLKRHPVVYLLSHMMIMPLIDWFATGCEWAHGTQPMPTGLFWFLAASFCNGIVIELGRKIRSPEQEEAGVETYTVLWGRPVAVGVWLTAQALTFASAIAASSKVGFAAPVAVVLAALWLGSLVLSVSFCRTINGRRAKMIEHYSGIWTLALYLMLGVIPLVLKHR